ncbi:MAG: hypothetical protein GDA44_06445 [Prochloron sp. SP5CPC1]|nr:hypothetical protein [Candidatus Paraprochloron terpiosi SP5CPC1]
MNLTILRLKHQKIAAAITLGFGLCFLLMFLWEGIPGTPFLSLEGWLMVGSLLPTSLWLLLPWQLGKKDSFSAQVYAPATDGWGKALALLQLIILSFHSFLLVKNSFVLPSLWAVFATVFLIGAMAARTWQRPTNVVIYLIGWGLEVLTIEVLGLIHLDDLSLTMVNIGLGLLTQLLGDWWLRRHPNQSIPHSINILPLFYGAVAIFCRWDIWAVWTGFSTLGLALIALGIGRRRSEFKFLIYLGLSAVSLSAYELLWVQIESFPAGDKCVAMATLGMGIMSAYRFLTPFLTKQLILTSQEVKRLAHFHWLGSSVILALATMYPVTFNNLLGLETGILLTSYAILQGREKKADPLKVMEQQAIDIKELWVYVGILEGLGVAVFASSQLQLDKILLPWSGAIATIIASGFYFLPWSNWGWSKKPWQGFALVGPFIAAIFTSSTINSISLGALTVCYVIFARNNQQIRLTYVSLFFLNWLILREWSLMSSLWLVTPPMLSLLYIAQVDPHLKQPQEKSPRHYLRLLATGTICLVALVTTNWLVTQSLTMLAILAGLIARVRAFLYVGTLILLVNIGNEFLLLSYQYPFSKWAMGLILGLLLIWIAASFETRQKQIITLLKNWITEFEHWQ